MKQFLKDTVYKNAYFLIGAAWLFTLSFIFSNYWSYTSSPQGVKKTLENYLHQHENNFDAFIEDTNLIRRLVDADESENDLIDITSRRYGIFIYQIEDYGPLTLKFWSTQQALPTDEMLSSPVGEYLERLPNGQYEFVNRKFTLPDGRNLLLVGLIPIRWSYFIENTYLQNGFVDHPNVEKNYTIAPEPTAYPVNNKNGKTMFYLEQKGGGQIFSNDWVTLLLRLMGSLLILFYMHVVAVYIARRFGAVWSISFLTVVIVCLRIFSYFFPIPIHFRQFELFDPTIYGSSLVLRSLGDLLINSLLFFWLAIFARTQLNKFKVEIKLESKFLRIAVSAVLVTIILVLTLLGGYIIRSLVSESKISFDVTNFFSLNLYSVFGFIVLCCVSMGYFIVSQIILQFIDSFPERSYFFKALVISLLGLAYLTLRIENINVKFELYLLIWLLVYIFLVEQITLRGSRYISGSSAVFWLVIFSASITTVIITENSDRELGQRERAAEKLAIQADPSSEILMNIAIQSLGNDFLLKNLPRFRSEVQSTILKDSLVNANFTGYLNKYETVLYAFDSEGKPMSSSDQLTYDALNTIYTMQGRRTGIADLKYYEIAFDKFSYIYEREIKDSSGTKWATIFMLSTPRRYKSEALYPELIKQSDEFSFEQSPMYAYAVYDSMELINNENDYPFPFRLDSSEIPKTEFDLRRKNGYNELWYKAKKDKVVVISRKSNFLLEAITLFAYLFCAFLFLVGVFLLANIVVKSGFRWSTFREIWHMNIRTQIYSTIIFVSVFSFVIIGAATIVFFINRYEKNNQDKLSRTIQVMSSDLKNRISDHSISDDLLPVYDSVSYEKIQRKITEISEIHNADINLYNTNGSLQVSSQPFVYNKGILSRMMDPVAFYNMKRLRKIQYVQYEKYSRLKYLSIYVPVRDDQSKITAYLNIPYFASTRNLNQEISNFLVTIINLNAFIFLIAGVIAVFITNRITNSFLWIGERMQEVNLGKHNQEISWGKRDEIGGLVHEYNKMVRKLEESAVALAKTEREGAWREMARQVAHEIKNPLTPMKLSIQYLQKAIDNNAPNVKELSSNVAKTLIEQIEHLSKIAAEFSQFANIGTSQTEMFDLHDLLNSLVSLHRGQENTEVGWQPVHQQVMINADKTQINRLFTNLLQNAVEAIPEDRKGIIHISEEMNNGQVIVKVQDNGSGIPKETQSKIFSPNFTTKTSGTGLGLAMCKGIIEHAKGEIWFETKEGAGTTFFVSLPVEKNHHD